MRLAIRLSNIIVVSIFSILISCAQLCFASNLKQLTLLKKAYPDFIKEVSSGSLTWVNNDRVNIHDNTPADESPSLHEQLIQAIYPANKIVHCKTYIPKNDPGRTRNEPFFAKMYGRNKNDVRNNLDTVYWMPAYFNYQYPLLITQVNSVNIKLKHVSDQLELLVKKHPDFLKYLNKPSGAFYWRHIQNSERRSPHSFGIAIDINSSYANYWIWDTAITENKINQSDDFPYRNHVPCEIVSIFENNGFIWGGKWLHYDTMHFEYRPELLS